MAARRHIRLPVQPLLDWAHRHDITDSVRGLAMVLADRDPVLGAHRLRNLQRWRQPGIPLPSAIALVDELCAAYGAHPVDIWGDDWIALPDDPCDVIGWHVARIRIAIADRAANTTRTRHPTISAPRSIP
jgi:hypothetical protein